MVTGAVTDDREEPTGRGCCVRLVMGRRGRELLDDNTLGRTLAVGLSSVMVAGAGGGAFFCF